MDLAAYPGVGRGWQKNDEQHGSRNAQCAGSDWADWLSLQPISAVGQPAFSFHRRPPLLFASASQRLSLYITAMYFFLLP